MQILIVVASGCKPNSPIEGRDWMNLRPRGADIPELRRANNALVHAKILIRAPGGNPWKVKPSKIGYELVERYRLERQALRKRPIMYDRQVSTK